VDDRDQTRRLVDALVERARALTDEDRLRLAASRGAVDESFHVAAWRAASEMLSMRADIYASAWQRIGPAFVPNRLVELVQLGQQANPEELREWQNVARLVRLGIDDELLAVVTADSIPPPHLRQLHMPWKTMLDDSPVEIIQP
jgi:hypothetical protein